MLLAYNMHSETAYHSLVPSQDIGEKGFLIFPFNFSVAVCNTTKGTVVRTFKIKTFWKESKALSGWLDATYRDPN
jgi:hypothetical protein